MQELLQENHQLLAAERTERERMGRNEGNFKTELEEIRRRWERAEEERTNANRELENLSLTIRVLREENRNIEKVMSEQLSQRKAIIEQLVAEKRMLYAQLHQ